MQNLIGLDFETYSGTDLLKHGLARYVKCEHFTPLLAVVSWHDPYSPTGYRDLLLDFVEDYEEAVRWLRNELQSKTVVAHNAGFEQAVLQRMGFYAPSDMFIDSAVAARAAGAAGKLEAAAPQLLDEDKVAIGYDLIKKFSIPGQYQKENGNLAFDPRVVDDNPDDWAEFGRYCGIDAKLSLRIVREYPLSLLEEANMHVTMNMNLMGWHVDLPTVERMQQRYFKNMILAEEAFRSACDEPDLNLSSFPQLRDWCEKRGVRATSFDEEHVTRMRNQLIRRLASPGLDDTTRENYEEVACLLTTKQMLGGSSLKKLQTIVDTTADTSRLHDQYLHIGAGASFRTTGRGVQMQNLKRLSHVRDMEELLDEDSDWSNDDLAANLRQVFTATDPKGYLIVGDFSSVESRGLAWLAGESWKLNAYFAGQDLYKVQAGLIYGKDHTEITKEERQIGKVGELACGYGAGAEAVRSFAQKMGTDLTEGEAAKLVSDWRRANPQIVRFWADLDNLMKEALEMRRDRSLVLQGGRLIIQRMEAPASLVEQVGDPDLGSLRVTLYTDHVVLSRVIHGARIVGRNIEYFKPSERKTGDLWSDTFTDPKTKRRKTHTLYGGKLAGILTQSLCRELFFDSLRSVHGWARSTNNVRLVGQFHDEIVLDWSPPLGLIDLSLEETKAGLERSMTACRLTGFPLAAEIKYDYRYTK